MWDLLVQSLSAEWATQVLAELILTLLGSFYVVQSVLQRVKRQESELRIKEGNELIDDYLQLCSNRFVWVEGRRCLEMVNLGSQRRADIFPDKDLCARVDRLIRAKREAVSGNQEDAIYLSEDQSDISPRSSLVLMDNAGMSKKVSGYLYDLLAARRSDLIYYFGPGRTLLFALHYEKVHPSANQRPRLFLFDVEMLREVHERMLGDREGFLAQMSPMVGGARHHLNRFCAMTELYVCYLAQQRSANRPVSVWAYVTPARFDGGG